MKPFIFITRKIPVEIIQMLEEKAEVEIWKEEEIPVSREVLLEKAAKADALYTMLSDVIDKEVLEKAINLKVVANLAVGFDNIDVEEAKKRGIVVCNTPDVLTDTTADLAFTLMLASARRIVESYQYMKEGKWNNWAPLLMAGTDIHHKTVGIVGMGKIGQAVAKRALGFDMKVIYHNRTKNEGAEKALGAVYHSFDDLLQQADFVVSLLPLSEETKGKFDAAAFAQMKRSAFFINAGRGGVVVEEDLIDALYKKELAGAGLDVFEKEPIDVNHPLLHMPNVTATPHIGSSSSETRMDMAKLAARNILLVLEGKKAETSV